MRNEFAKLLKLVRKTLPDEDDALIRKAYRVADKAHQGQFRLSREPYISHCLEVASILTKLGMDKVTISASLLHDVLEDTSITFEELEKEFGTDIAKLVDKFRQEGFEARVSLKPRQYRKAGKTHCGIGLLEFIA